MNIAIVEDEIEQQMMLNKELSKLFLNNAIKISTFNSGEEILSSYLNGNYFDIIFMDIRMKKMNGIETIKQIKEFDTKGKIIITTSLIEYAIVGYSIKVDDFILKPINELNLKKVIQRVVHDINMSRDRIYVLENRNEITKLHYDDILFIESFGRKLLINSIKGTFEHYRSISEDEKNLLNGGFVRTHRAYIVNMRYIYQLKKNEIIMSKNNLVLPISRKRYQYVYDQFTNFMIGEIQ